VRLGEQHPNHAKRIVEFASQYGVLYLDEDGIPGGDPPSDWTKTRHQWLGRL
jgi:hypothetical protein